MKSHAEIPPFKLKGMFICNFCRNICRAGCAEDLERLENGIIDDKNKDLSNNRKQSITCLGKYCDMPCKLQDKNAKPSIDVLINSIYYLGETTNKLIEKNNKLKEIVGDFLIKQIPILKNKNAKRFVQGAVRLYLDGQLEDEHDMEFFNSALGVIFSGRKEKNYDDNLNNLSYDDIICEANAILHEEIKINTEIIKELNKKMTKIS